LEHDFNWGLPIDWNSPKIHDVFITLKGFGFDADQCYEAIIVTDSKSTESAVNYALMDEKSRHKMYDRMKRKLNRTKIRRLNDEDYSHYTNSRDFDEMRLAQKWTQTLKAMNRQKNPSQNGCSDILNEIGNYKKKTMELKMQRERLQKKQRERVLIVYTEFVRGILSSGSLNIEQVGEWKTLRDQHGITEKEHTMILQQFGFKNDDDLDRIKTYVFVEGDGGDGEEQDLALKESKTACAAVTGRGGECIICWSKINHENTGYMITPCNHIVLCGECSATHFAAPHHGQKCPKCVQDVTDVKEIYFS